MKKILFGISVFLSALISAQNYPDSYPSNNNSNNSYYGDEEDAAYFPDDYYYEYPSDYYTNDFYQSSYNDYRRSIYDVNWNRFFARYRLSPWQVQQIMMLNDSYPSFSVWNSYYRYNPDRWYYDRFYALQNIMGPRIFVVFQNNYYRGYNPVVYYQNYRRQHYVTNIYVVPRYRNININRYRIDRSQFQQNNPRKEIGFNTTRNNVGNWQNNSNSGGFRNDTNSLNSSTNGGFRNNQDNAVKNVPQISTNDGFRNNSDTSVKNIPQSNNGGFRNNTATKPQLSNPKTEGSVKNNDSGFRNRNTERKIENNSGSRKSPGTDVKSSNRSAQKFTARKM